MTSNGNEGDKKYMTDDGYVFNSYTQALQYVLSEANKTSSCTGGIIEFNEYYY